MDHSNTMIQQNIMYNLSKWEIRAILARYNDIKSTNDFNNQSNDIKDNEKFRGQI